MFTNGICTFDGLKPVCPVESFTTCVLMTAIESILRSTSKFDVVGY